MAEAMRVSILTRGKPRVELGQGWPSFNIWFVSILTRGKPRVELPAVGDMIWADMFQSSLEGNPEWNAAGAGTAARATCFNPHSRETPSGTCYKRWEATLWLVSILTRGKPRVEPRTL